MNGSDEYSIGVAKAQRDSKGGTEYRDNEHWTRPILRQVSSAKRLFG